MIVRVGMWIAITASVAAAIAACGSFAADETGNGAGDGAAGDGGTVDPTDGASDSASSTDAGADAPSDGRPLTNDNLLLNPDFEEGSSCYPWDDNTAALTRNARSHSGKASCSVCGIMSAGSWSLNQILQLSGSSPGSTYHFEAWTQQPEAGAPVAGTVYCRLEVFDKAHASLQYVDSTKGLKPTATWSKCMIDLPLSAVAADAGVTLETVVIGTDSNTCFLVDDATLQLRP